MCGWVDAYRLKGQCVDRKGYRGGVPYVTARCAWCLWGAVGFAPGRGAVQRMQVLTEAACTPTRTPPAEHTRNRPQVRDRLQTQHRDALGQRNLSRLLRELGVLAKGRREPGRA